MHGLLFQLRAIAEYPVGKELPFEFNGYSRSKDYKYGNKILTIYRKDSVGEAQV